MKITAASDHTAVLTVNGLAAGHEYEYTILIGGQPVELPYPAVFQTAPEDGEPEKFSFAFGGGAGYVTKHEHMWDVIARSQPDALMLLGDNMYSDDPQSRSAQRFCYYRRQSPLPFRKLVARTAVYSIWDDHDFGTNDCSGGPDVDSPDWKLPVWNTYRNNWVNPGYGGGESRPGCWYAFRVGDVRFIMLDGRYYRHRPGKTMLGPDQKAWLKKQLTASESTFTVIASPVPWEYRTKGQSKDTWNGFQEERKEIFDFLAENKIGGVLLISADRHRSDAWKIDRPNGYSLYEFNSSRLTNTHVHGTMKEAIFSYNKKQSFGLVEFDLTAADPTVSYTVINIDGEKMHTLQLKRSQLK
ncbi:MAG: alkaline phosphatase family protein [Planctomycetales bacterium]